MCPLNSTGTELLTLYSLPLTLYCCFFLFLLSALWGFCGFCSSTRDWSSTTAVKAPSPNQWIRELPLSVSYLSGYLMFISYSNPEAQKSSLILSSPPIPDLSFACSCLSCQYLWIPSGGSDGKESAHNARDPSSIPGLERYPAEGHSNPLQYSCLGNPTNRGAWLQSMGSGRVGYFLSSTSWTKLFTISCFRASHCFNLYTLLNSKYISCACLTSQWLLSNTILLSSLLFNEDDLSLLVEYQNFFVCLTGGFWHLPVSLALPCPWQPSPSLSFWLQLYFLSLPGLPCFFLLCTVSSARKAFPVNLPN